MKPTIWLQLSSPSQKDRCLRGDSNPGPRLQPNSHDELDCSAMRPACIPSFLVKGEFSFQTALKLAYIKTYYLSFFFPFPSLVNCK